MEISTALLNTQSPDFTTRQQAETFLHNALEAHMGSFMITLVQALSSEEFPVIGRQAAGLYLKNVLAAKDEVIQQQKIQQWTSLSADIRLQIKEGVIHVLQSSDATARHTSAQVIAKIGSIELPLQQWPTLLDQLLGNVTNGSDGTIHATLECLGFLCEELMEDCLEETDTNRILTAIVDGMRSDRPLPIQYVATQALRNSLEFISTNFTRPTERDHIMQKVCEATQSNDLRTRVVAFECISVIITCYYDYLSNYMDTICQLTFAAITKDQSEVSLQALEVWSSMCDVEMELIEEMEYNSNSTCFYYVKTVLPTLIPLLTQVLTQQEEDQDEDSWNVSMAAATCLALVAQTVGDEVVPLTMAFITSHINSNDWRAKEAAIMAFGSILDGPNTTTIAPVVQQALSFLMNCMNFDHLLVRDTTAWTLGRICELHVSCIDATTLDPMMCLLLKGLSQEPRVSHNICYAIHHIVKAFEEHQIELLLPYFNTIFDQLLATAARKDAQESHLIDASYEALSMLIEVSSKEMESHLLLRLPVLLERLETSFQLETTEDIGNVQALLCGVLVASIQKLNEAIIPYSDRIMQALLAVFASRHVTAAEEAFQAVGALANALNEGFLPYMDYIMPLLITGLQNSEEYMVCTAAVGVVGDLCRALEKHILCHCDVLMSTLMDILKNPNLNRSVKPPVLACFGDIALAIGVEMERYLNPCMQMIIQAATACALIEGEEEEEMMEYMNQLRESVLEALTGITQGLHGSSEGNNSKARLLLEYAQPMATFLMTIAKDTQRFEAVTKGAVGLLGDMGQALGMEVAVLAKQTFVHQLISECSQLEDGRETAMWAASVLRPLCM